MSGISSFCALIAAVALALAGLPAAAQISPVAPPSGMPQPDHGFQDRDGIPPAILKKARDHVRDLRICMDQNRLLPAPLFLRRRRLEHAKFSDRLEQHLLFHRCR